MNKAILIGAASTLALSACANMGQKGLDGGEVAAATTLDLICATDQVRCIDVFVESGRITYVKDEEFGGPNHLILWKLNPLGAPYTFADKGIDFKASSPARPGNEFNCRPVAQRRFFLCSNRNTVRGTYTYNVTLKDAAGNPIPTFDPKIVNQ